jgi:1,4-alpha-glucan branching enzyme
MSGKRADRSFVGGMVAGRDGNERKDCPSRALSRHQTLKTDNKEKGNSMARKNINTKQQTFSIAANGAINVALAGDFTNWQEKAIPMQIQPNGEWKAVVELAPGTYHYRYIVDGQWCDDPKCPLHMPNPYGSQNSVRQVV